MACLSHRTRFREWLVNSNIIVGIPAFNEERMIAAVVRGSLPFATSVVVVDDGSHDQTGREALEAGATLIRHQENAGKGAAIASLFQFAIQEGAEALVLLDGDGQHSPAEIPNLLAPCLSGAADVVVGSRFHPNSHHSTPRIRRVGQLAFNAMTSIASGVPCSDSQSGFRAFSRRAFSTMRLTETSFSVESEMQFECKARRLRLAEVPISCSYEMPPKRNVLVHGGRVLTRLTSMAIQRRTFGQAPVQPLPCAARTVTQAERRMERPMYPQALRTNIGD
jgi:glycosyltransferase involved in cell wall biosynthesis